MLRFLFSLLCALSLCFQANAQCQYHLAMFDSFNDGWTGGKVTIVNGTLTTDLSLATGSKDTASFDVQSGELLVLSWTAGTFPTDVSFVLYNNFWEPVFTSVQPLPTGKLFEAPAVCGTCQKPQNAFVENVYDTRAKLRWQPGSLGGAAQSWLVIYGEKGFAPGAGDTVQVPTPKATLTGLQKKTWYDAYIVQLCDAADSSSLVGPLSFQTYWSNDVGISAVVTPVSSCDIGYTTVTVRMSNYGANPQSLIPFRYAVNGLDAGVNQPQDGFYTGVLGKDSSDVLEFDLQYDFSKPGEYEITAFTQLPGDEDSTNNSITYYVNNRLEPPYFQNFEKWDGGWSVDTASKRASWAHGAPAKLGINTAASGNNAWVTSLTGLYNVNEHSYLASPCFDFSKLTEEPVIQFQLNHDLEKSYDGAALEMSFDNKTWSKIGKIGEGINWYNEKNTNNSLGEVWSSQSGGWVLSRHQLTGTKGEKELHFRFRLDSDGVVPAEGIAIDDIRIFVPQAKDFSALALTTEGDQNPCGLEKDSVRMTLANLGTTAQATYKVAYSINGKTPVIETINQALLLPEQLRVYTFKTTFDSRDGLFNIRCWTLLPGEQNLENDSAAIYTIDHRPLPVPFQEGFESSTTPPAGWITEGFVTSGHNNKSNVLAVEMSPFNTSFITDLPRFGYIQAGDSLRFDYRVVNLTGTSGAPLQVGSKIEVQISDDCGDTYKTVYTISSFNHPVSVNFKTVHINLNAYTGKALFVRFKGTWGIGDFYFDLDNINLRACASSMALSATTKGATAGQSNGSATIIVGLGNPPYEFKWSQGTTTTDPSLAGLAVGDYTVSVTDSKGCSDTLVVSIGISAVNDIQYLTAMTLQPNPTNGVSTLHVEFERPASGLLQVLNLLGQPVAGFSFENASTLNETLDLDKQPAGLYLVQLTVEGQVTMRKLLRR